LEQQQNSAKLLIRRDLELTRANDRLRALDRNEDDFVSGGNASIAHASLCDQVDLEHASQGDIGTLDDDSGRFLMKSV